VASIEAGRVRLQPWESGPAVDDIELIVSWLQATGCRLRGLQDLIHEDLAGPQSVVHSP
jgi:hypothetical protein